MKLKLVDLWHWKWQSDIRYWDVLSNSIEFWRVARCRLLMKWNTNSLLDFYQKLKVMSLLLSFYTIHPDHILVYRLRIDYSDFNGNITHMLKMKLLEFLLRKVEYYVAHCWRILGFNPQSCRKLLLILTSRAVENCCWF